MGKPPVRMRIGCIGLTLLLTAGCGLTPDVQSLFPPESRRLIPAAKAISRAMPEPVPLPRELDKGVLPPYTVEPGDILLVQPADLDSPVRLPADQPVLPDGSITLGRYGRLVVAGRTLDQIEAEVHALIAAQTSDAGPITVRLVARQSKVYYVLGEVNAPGSFTLTGRETVLDALLTAGGLTDRASRRHIILVRPTAPESCRIVLPVCYAEIVQLGDTSTNYQLAPGDRVFVPARGLCETLLHFLPECLPCGRPQVPCPPVPSCGVAPADVPPPAPEILPAPKPRPAGS